MHRSIFSSLSRLTAVVCLLLGVVVVTGCGNRTEERRADGTVSDTMMNGSMRDSMTNGSGMQNNNMPMLSDEEFMKAAAQTNLAEIAAGTAAARMGHSKAIQQYGKKMVADHNMVNSMLMGIAKTKNVTLPAQPDSAHHAALRMMEKEKMMQFDMNYIQAQVKDHEAAIALFESEANNGKDGVVKNFASSHVGALKGHLARARALADSLATAK